MRNTEQRINIIIGQLEAVKKMSKQKKDNCFDLVNQLKAVKSGVSSLMNKVLQEELDICFDKKCSDSREDLKKVLSEFFKNNN
jgi:DNA-binding FrmR family transcriptional regulator